MNTKHLITFLFVVLACFGGKSQEQLGELPYRAEQYNTSETRSKNIASRSDVQDSSISYLLNTLELPIIDDFSRNRTKVFHKNLNHPSIFDSTSYLFRVNGLAEDSVKFMYDTVYNYIVDPVSGNIDSTTAQPITIEFYDTADAIFIVKETLIGFPTRSLYIENGITRTINYNPDSSIKNFACSNFFARDDDFSYWIAPGPFLNNTMAIEPPTIGVLTFDGLDSNGIPYDNSSKLTYGISDFLTSKPINLFDRPVGVQRQRYSIIDSVYFSFFYQAAGNGDKPEDEDSLIVEFYNPITFKWNVVWSAAGDTAKDFERVSIHVSDSNLLQNGFRFRFKNYATQSGNFDHWHIDYIRLIEKGGKADEIKDFAISKPIRSMLKDYTAMPWEHYKEDPNAFMIDTVNLQLRNLSFTSDVLTSRYKVYKRENVNYSFISNEIIQSSIGKETKLPFTVQSRPNNYRFPTDELERQYFNCVFETFSSQDVYRFNDTLKHTQIFDRYYSYDDRSAEKTYHLNLVGTNIAVRFNTPIEDTLKSILINFVQTFEATTAKHRVKFKVYEELTSEPLYESEPFEIQRTAPGSFMRFLLPEEIIVDGDFYIGWEQVSDGKTFVGYDINYNNQDNTFISEVEGVWFNSQFTGTVMLRADFGDGSEKPLSKKEVNTEISDFSVFPNPSEGIFKMKGVMEAAPIQLFNLQGALVRSWDYNKTNTYEINELENGIYILATTDENGKPVTSKIILAK